jgi:hypothetical protein
MKSGPPMEVAWRPICDPLLIGIRVDGEVDQY